MPLVGLLLGFVTILVLVGRRVGIGIALLAGAATLALFSGLTPIEFTTIAWRGLSRRETVELVLDVAVITSLAGVLKRFGLLQTMVQSVTALLGGARLAIMAVPSLIGALPVLGGAILSAPMVDGLGDRLGLTQARKAAVNLVFRHAWFYIAPFAPSVVLAGRLADVPVGQLILRQAPCAAVMLLMGYLVLLRKLRSTPDTLSDAMEPAAMTGGFTPATAAGPLLRSASPIIVGVGLSFGAGPLNLPLYVTIGIGLGLALYLSRGRPGFRLGGLPAAWTSIQWNIVLTMAAVMIFGQVMRESGATAGLVDGLGRSGLPTWVLMLALPAVVGYAAGAPTVTIGVSFPALLPLAPAGHTADVAAVLYCAGFLAYFISPIHLCQVLSSQFFQVTVPRIYREYWPVALALAALTAAYALLVLA
jgi:hypothetical protein